MQRLWCFVIVNYLNFGFHNGQDVSTTVNYTSADDWSSYVSTTVNYTSANERSSDVSTTVNYTSANEWSSDVSTTVNYTSVDERSSYVSTTVNFTSADEWSSYLLNLSRNFKFELDGRFINYSSADYNLQNISGLSMFDEPLFNFSSADVDELMNNVKASLDKTTSSHSRYYFGAPIPLGLLIWIARMHFRSKRKRSDGVVIIDSTNTPTTPSFISPPPPPVQLPSPTELSSIKDLPPSYSEVVINVPQDIKIVQK